MKIKGQKLSTVNKVTIVIPRSEGEDIVFVAAAVLDSEEFDVLVPEPKPPMILRRGETIQVPDLEDKNYKEQLTNRAKLQTYWLIIKSLMATPDLEWELVKVTDSSTWEKLEEEFKSSGLTPIERNQVIQGVMRANSLDIEYIEKAKERFFAGVAGRKSHH